MENEEMKKMANAYANKVAGFLMFKSGFYTEPASDDYSIYDFKVLRDDGGGCKNNSLVAYLEVQSRDGAFDRYQTIYVNEVKADSLCSLCKMHRGRYEIWYYQYRLLTCGGFQIISTTMDKILGSKKVNKNAGVKYDVPCHHFKLHFDSRSSIHSTHS